MSPSASFLVGIVTTLLVLGATQSCGDASQGVPVDKDDPTFSCTSEGAFQCITINGMPCIKWAEYHDSSTNRVDRTYSGLTCDWRDR